MTRLAVVSCLALASQVDGYNWTKPGLAWPNSYYVPMAGFDGNNTLISSYYNWSPSPAITPKGYSSLYAVPFPFIPMLWGCNATYTDPFQSAVDSNFSNAMLTSDRVVLGFNEPDITGQSDCSPSDAASAWKTYLEPLRSKGYRVGSPAVSSGTAGKEWLEDWFEACGGGCNPNFIALHWYDIDAGDFIDHVKDYYQTWNKSLWVTEFAVQNFTGTGATQATLSQINQFMDVVVAWMETVEYVERYFWFGAMYDMQGVNPLNCLFDSAGEAKRTGALNSLGVKYAGSNGSLTLASGGHGNQASSATAGRPDFARLIWPAGMSFALGILGILGLVI
ncbi:hypothetical protein JCM24511_07634 [Saitozyma sp. JCM 24511]|nr:hypothetical protein JCM24511_07634 [Saitozyma sp. JCM 24511]